MAQLACGTATANYWRSYPPPADGAGLLPSTLLDHAWLWEREPTGPWPCHDRRRGRKVLTQRHPTLTDQISSGHPYPPGVQRRLDVLREEIAGTVRPLPDGAAGKHAWDTWGEGIYGCDWLDVPFLWAESYIHRLLLEAVGVAGETAE